MRTNVPLILVLLVMVTVTLAMAPRSAGLEARLAAIEKRQAPAARQPVRTTAPDAEDRLGEMQKRVDFLTEEVSDQRAKLTRMAEKLGDTGESK